MNRLPSSVTSQRGMLAKKPTFSMVSIISCGTLTLAALMPPRPRAFGAFTVVSMIFAVLSVLCGGFYLFIAFGYGVSRFTLFSGAFSGMLVLYGLLAIYFGVRDIMGSRSRIVTE